MCQRGLLVGNWWLKNDEEEEDDDVMGCREREQEWYKCNLAGLTGSYFPFNMDEWSALVRNGQ